MKTHKTIAGKSYTVSCSEPCKIKAQLGTELVLLASGEAGTQFCFVAPVGAVTSSSDKAILTVNFNTAPLGGSSQSAKPYMPIVELNSSPGALELKGGVMYRYVFPIEAGTTAWNNLTMEQHSDRVITCEICIDSGLSSNQTLTWPVSWIWMDEQTAPDLSRGGLHYFALRSDQRLSYIVEHTHYLESKNP